MAIQRQKCSVLKAFVRIHLVNCVLILLASSNAGTTAKRFDCRVFCKETGYHGMVGGCRCSFTLFTAKRAVRDPVRDWLIEENLKRYLKKSQIQPFAVIEDDSNYPGLLKNNWDAKIRLSFDKKEDKALRDPRNEFMSYNMSLKPPKLTKRLEYEEESDNGQTKDFLRTY